MHWYMMQPQLGKAPAYCLCCIGLDNKFSAELVLKSWSYIYSELSKQGIHLLSTAYGDSRLCKFQFSCCDHPQYLCHTSCGKVIYFYWIHVCFKTTNKEWTSVTVFTLTGKGNKCNITRLNC